MRFTIFLLLIKSKEASYTSELIQSQAKDHTIIPGIVFKLSEVPKETLYSDIEASVNTKVVNYLQTEHVSNQCTL